LDRFDVPGKTAEEKGTAEISIVAVRVKIK
jgi:hypothetical protein